MKKRKIRNNGFSALGSFIFFVLIALITQFSILAYTQIIKWTTNIATISILILFLILLLAAFCTVFDILRRKLTVERPVKKILEATEKIAQGNFEVRLDITHEYSHYNEYDLIMENLNVMVAELQKNEVLKNDFISNVSHELKTPLAVIQSYATMLSDENLDAESRKKYAQTLAKAVKRLSNLITNILKLNKLENQETKPESVHFNLTEALANVVVNYDNLLEEKNIDLQCNFDEITVTSAPGLLDLVWNNLLSNAIKFTDINGKISIGLKRQGTNVCFRISDSGCGIDPKIGARIFEKFYQGDTSHTQEGNGLGLALVKKVIDILGGEISVSSELGKGSTFTIKLKDVIDEK